MAQKTIVKGKVYDRKTGEALSFVNVAFKGSKIGTSTDINGFYRIETYYATDSLTCSFVGYKKQSKKVKKDVAQVIDFPLIHSSVEFSEFVVKADKKEENPAHKILRRVIANKKANNREKLDAYQYRAYNKIEFDVNNITEEYKNKRVFRPFQFVFNYIDTTEAKDFLPLFMTENISDYYYRKSPKSQKEIINATKVSGVENESVSQFLGDMYQNMNIYQNYVTFFHKSFITYWLNQLINLG
ncbi:MAG: carboxypeptidase-like regulatory domain-containing protein, partial [Flavobacteriales bacterium]